ncbi:MAG: lysylphosphatidylglycerol synthase domain-containing protein [Chromatiales bacterium]
MKRWRWKTGVIVLSLAFMLWLLVDQWSKIRNLNLEVRPAMMAAALIALVVLFFLDAYGWHLILRSLGPRPEAPSSIRIWMVSALTRYLPGGVWGYLSRAAMCTERGIPLVTSSLSLYLETLLLTASSLAVGFPALLSATGFPIDPTTAGLLWLVLGLLLHPKAIALTRHLPGRPGRVLAATSLPSQLQTLSLYLYYLAFWTAFGAVFVCFVLSLYPLSPSSWVPVGASISMSFLVGFITVFVPGGIGVRESVLYLLLLPFMPPAACLLISIGSRLWIMAGEAISVGIAVAVIPAAQNRDRKRR